VERSTAVGLITDGIERSKAGQCWADLGAGTGLFTQALVTLLPADSVVYAVDRNQLALRQVPEAEGRVRVIKCPLDFEREDFGLTKMDGILMANSLHFVKDQRRLLRKLMEELKVGGRFLILEYDTDQSSPWIPYPVNFEALEIMAGELGLSEVRKLNAHRSRFRAVDIYAAMVRK
jgi:ubiquinone/menaquinone biosynthesis C-methylase UbiE